MSTELVAVLVPLIVALTAYLVRQYPAKRTTRQILKDPEFQALLYDAVKAEQQRRDAGKNGGKLPYNYDQRLP